MKSHGCAISRRTASICALIAFSVAGAGAQTITVTTLDDIVDFGGAQQIANLPGPDARVSMREACTAANNTAGPQTIAFAIPQSEWWLDLSLAILRQENGVFYVSDNETTIDFTTQTDFTGDTNPNGWEVGIFGLEPNGWGIAAIMIAGNNCTVRGLDHVWQRGHGVELVGDNNRVVGCNISGPLSSAVNVEGVFNLSVAENNVVGGTGPGEGNVLSGISVLGPAANTVVIGNLVPLGGIRIEGATQFNANVTGVRVGGPTPAERNVVYGSGGWGEEGFPSGTQIEVVDASNVTVEGNFIGTNLEGTAVAPLQRGTAGVGLRHARDTIIRDNVIAGMVMQGTDHYAGQRFGAGIAVSGRCENTTIIGNRIGTDVTGQVAIPNRTGVQVTWLSSNDLPTGTVVGSVQPGEANLVAFNETAGVMVSSLLSGVCIRGNSIHDNAGIGIDLIPNSGGSGVTPNDIGDADAGGNGLQNFPLLMSAETSGAATMVAGTFNSRPNATFTLDFYESPQCDASGAGEGARWLAATAVSTNASGNASVAATLPVATTVGQVITATATDAQNNTSEFSNCVNIAQSQATPGDVDGDGDVDLSDLTVLLASFGLCAGDAGFDPAADFDVSGCVELGDLSLLLANFGT